jgi:hypothetical protein
MKVYRFKNATIRVHGEVSKERLRKATIQLMKQSIKRGVDVNDYKDSPRGIEEE